MYPPANEVRRVKCLIKGQKFYRPVLGIKRQWRVLRHISRTAAGAMRYGQKVLDRYLHWCDIALS
jgi:hypothetical protein